MRFPLPVLAAAVLLAVPAALAAFHGGYGEEARLAAGVVIWLLVQSPPWRLRSRCRETRPVASPSGGSQRC